MGSENNNIVLILLSWVLFSSFFFTGNANDPEVDDETKFSYDLGAPTGPHNWSMLNTNWTRCGTGKSQSPINIVNLNISSGGGLMLNYRPSPARITNRGHDIEVVWSGDAGGIVINGTEFKLEQCHWHTPSEHKVNSIRFDMELHIVHFSAQRDIAVVGILYKLGCADPFLTQLAPFIPSATRNGTNLGIVDPNNIGFINNNHYYNYNGSLTIPPCSENVTWPILRDLAPFIPSVTRNGTNLGIVNPNNIGFKNNNHYYSYNGSLTTPPCSENVTWSILKEVRTVSFQQIELLRNAVHDEHGITGNARPIQELNGRPVYLFKT